MFREAVLAFLGVKESKLNQKEKKAKSCRVSSACSMCNKQCSERVG